MLAHAYFATKFSAHGKSHPAICLKNREQRAENGLKVGVQQVAVTQYDHKIGVLCGPKHPNINHCKMSFRFLRAKFKL